MADRNLTTFHDLYELPRHRSPPPPGRMRSMSLQPSSGEPLFPPRRMSLQPPSSLPPRRLRTQSLQAPGEAPLASTSLMLTADSRRRSHPQSHSLQLADDYSRGRPRGVDAWTSRGRLVEETEMTTLQPSGERRRGSHPPFTSNLTTPWQRAGERRRGSHPQYSRNDSQHAQYTASWMTQTSGRRGSQLSTGSGYSRDTELMYIDTTPNSVSSQSSVNGSSMTERTDGDDVHLRDGGRQNGGENKPNNGTKKSQIKKDRHERESEATENTGRVQNTGHNTGLIHTNGVTHVCSRRGSQATQSVSGDGTVADMMDKHTTPNSVSNQSSVSGNNMKQRTNGDPSISTNDRNLEDSHARSFGPTVNPQQVQNTPQATQGTVAEMTDTHATHKSVSNQSSIIGHNMKQNSDGDDVHLRDGGRQNDGQNVGGNRPNNGINGRHRGLYGYPGPSEHSQHTNGLVRSTRLDHPGRVLVRRADVGTQSSTSWAADWKQRSSRCCSRRVLAMLFFVWFFGTLIFLVCIGAVAFTTLQHGGFTNRSVQTRTVAKNTPRADLQQENIQPQELTKCASSPCSNGGTCVDGVNQYTCTCPAGYTGLYCQTDIAECASSPCLNGAICVDGVNQYTCTCPVGYTGLNCQTDIAECASSPCLKGATCVDGLSQYTCTCPVGYTGFHCETNIAECASFPCLNGGTCVDGVNQYTCTCPVGYSGFNCQTECTSSPCLGPWSQVSTFDDKVYSDCLYLRHGPKGPLSDCRDECDRQPGCNIINYARSTACVLKSCGSSDLMISDWADGDEYAVHTRIVGD